MSLPASALRRLPAFEAQHCHLPPRFQAAQLFHQPNVGEMNSAPRLHVSNVACAFSMAVLAKSSCVEGGFLFLLRGLLFLKAKALEARPPSESYPLAQWPSCGPLRCAPRWPHQLPSLLQVGAVTGTLLPRAYPVLRTVPPSLRALRNSPACIQRWSPPRGRRRADKDAGSTGSGGPAKAATCYRISSGPCTVHAAAACGREG